MTLSGVPIPTANVIGALIGGFASGAAIGFLLWQLV